jgi:hypothetical protein
VVADFHRAAKNAKRSASDGVDIHGANGSLMDQILRDGTNHRMDAYGGSLRTARDSSGRVWNPALNSDTDSLCTNHGPSRATGPR